MSSRPDHKHAGFTFAEVAFGILAFVVAAAVLINHLTVNYSSTQAQKDRVFAFSKAQGILAEIQAYVDRGEIAAAIDLDGLDDGVVTKPTLTITTSGGVLVAPNHELSANIWRNGTWQWSRRITVQPFAGLSNRTMRYVTVRVYKRDGAGVERQMAELSSVVNSLGSAYPTAQVFDIYFLAIENIPGWWVYMEAIRPFVESMLTDLESRNPGLEVRTHWITKASYGRNPGYAPHINETVDSHQNVPFVYYYPGLMPSGSASTFYYVPDMMRGRMLFDGVERHGYQGTETSPGYNPHPYALADYYNHAMRLPAERAFHDLRVDAVRQAKANGNGANLDDDSEEPTLRLFLEDLNTDPDKYRNALVINLHGELLPIPSLRNYSDPAKDPVGLPDVRVVTHPERLQTDRTSQDAKFRVYAYTADPAAYTGADRMPTMRPIVLQIMGVNLTDYTNIAGPYPYLCSHVRLQRLPGGVDVGGDSTYRPWEASKHRFVPLPAHPQEMSYEVAWVPPSGGKEGFTLIALFNTPVKAPLLDHGGGIWRGLDATRRARLYNLEYVPSVCGAGSTDFSNTADLYTAGTGTKNTARWNLIISRDILTASRFYDATTGLPFNPPDDVQLTMRTRIWDTTLPDPLATGTAFPAPIQPDNLSETYTWWADSPADVPLTERYQFQGDPRHNPYEDLLRTGTLANGYNWHFDALNNNSENARADFPALDAARLFNEWSSVLRQDLPRFYELYRNGLVTSGIVYTTLTGFSYYYAGFGNEIGYDSANGYSSSIPVNLRPWGAPASTGFVNNITGSRNYVRGVGLAGAYWMGMPWLGDLYPDSAVDQWLPVVGGVRTLRGNLAAGNTAGTFFRQQDQTAYTNSRRVAYGTAMTSAHQRPAGLGCTTLFNLDDGGGRHFHHRSTDGQTGTLVGAGLELANNYNFPMPLTAKISRPFELYMAGSVGTHHNLAPFTSRFTGSLVRTYYNHQVVSATGSGLVELRNPANTSSAYIIVNGIDRTTETGSAFIAKYAMLSMVHSFFEGGSTALTHRILQPARVTIESPTEITELNNPASIALRYSVDWRRWDGQKYTGNTPDTFTEDESLIDYVIMYSRDAGTTWLYVQDDATATPGTKPTDVTYIVADAGAGDETFNWSVPALSFPEGSYLVRIEGYRRGQSLHYSRHQVKIFINR